MIAFILILGAFQSFGFVCSESCVQAQDYVCNHIPTDYPPGLSSLVFFVRNVGEINSTIFNFTNLSSVTSLTMIQSGITAIAPGAFAQFQNLKMLNLHNNDLSQISPDWFVHKRVLERLILTNNSITALNGNSFAGLVGLLNLTFSQNRIHSISSETFHFLIRLTHLDLSHNKLRHLSTDILMPLSNTKIFLNGNPWDCSCSMYEFALYLKELQSVSLLQNKMEVLCESPAHQRGRPVWNMSKCLNPLTDVALTTGTTQALTPGSTNLATIISLVVVLCALVLVICVLSVLYHRKQQQKHRLAIQPFPKEQESTRQAQADHSTAEEISKKVAAISCNQRKQESGNNRLLLRLDQTLLESQIYQIYSTGMYQTRETTGRAKSAGPVLSRTDGPERRPHTEVEDPGVLVTDQMVNTGLKELDIERLNVTTTEFKKKDGEHERNEKKEQAGKTEMEKKPIHLERQDDDELQSILNTLKKEVKYQEKLEDGKPDEHTVEENVNDHGTLHNEDLEPSDDEFDSDDDEYNLSSISATSQPHQERNNGFQPREAVENMPYLTIGADPEKQSPNTEQICTKTSTGQANLRPIRRTLSWPPTAAQWKKQWAQTQQVLSVSPKLIFVTQYEYRFGMFPFGITSAIPENIPQASYAGFPEQIQDLGHTQSVESSTETSKFFNRSCAQDLSGVIRDDINVNEVQPEVIQSHLPINNKAHPDMHVGISSEVVCQMKMRSSKQNKTNQTLKHEQTRVKTARQPKRAEQSKRKVLRTGPRNPSHPDSPAQPSGGSPSDDKLLVDNEYTFIDLLHEVVENHGRWTRDRWRQSHMNKQKMKQAAKS